MRAFGFASAVVAAALTLACSPDRSEEERLARGAATYTRYCALCHGDRGQGYVADNANALAHPEFLRSATDELLRRAIARGRPGTTMSGWGTSAGGPLGDGEVDDLVAFLRYWQQEDSLDIHHLKITGEVSRAEPVYFDYCEECHGKRGSGGTHLSIANPEFLASASDGFLKRAIQKGRHGTPMPGFIRDLTPQQVDDLVVLIRSWQRPPVDASLERPDATAPAVLNPGGPEAVFTEGPRFAPVDAVKRELDRGARLVILDARPPSDYVFEHIAGAISVPFYEVDAHAARIPKDAFVVTYCGCPHAESGAALDALARKGYTRLRVLDEGYYVWKGRGYPTAKGVRP